MSVHIGQYPTRPMRRPIGMIGVESIGEIPDRGVRVIADGTAEDARASWAMPSDDLIPRVRLLIANLRLQVSPMFPRRRTSVGTSHSSSAFLKPAPET